MVKKNFTVTITAKWVVEDATGPNPSEKPFQLMDYDGLRHTYTDTVVEAERHLAQYYEEYDIEGEVDIQEQEE